MQVLQRQGSLFSMEALTIIWGFVGLLAMLLVGLCLDEKKRVLEYQIEYVSARMKDLREILFSRVHRGKKQKLGNDLGHWMYEAHDLVKKAEFLLGQIGGWRSFLMSAKMTRDVGRLVDSLEAHNEKGGELFRRAMPDAQGPSHSYYLPVKAVVGQAASNTLEQLELLLQDDKVGRIAIHGVEGVGKTFLMKHLYNSALKWVEMFDHVIWVTVTGQFTTIKHAQDAVAVVVNCDLSSDDDLNVRARKLSDTLADLGSFVLFLDGVPGADFALEQVGIPVPAEGSKCKLVLSTSGTLEWKLLDHFEAVKVDPLPKEEAYQLFIMATNLGKVSVSSLDGIPSLLVDRCCGIPRMIVNIAMHIYGVGDPHEWRNALYEVGYLGMKNKLPFEVVIHQFKHDSEQLRRDVVPSSFALG